MTTNFERDDCHVDRGVDESSGATWDFQEMDYTQSTCNFIPHNRETYFNSYLFNSSERCESFYCKDKNLGTTLQQIKQFNLF